MSFLSIKSGITTKDSVLSMCLLENNFIFRSFNQIILNAFFVVFFRSIIFLMLLRVGSYQPNPANCNCDLCPAGFFCNDTLSGGQTPCPPYSYCPEGNLCSARTGF